MSERDEFQKALHDLDIAVGQAILSLPPVRWLMRAFGLKPKAKYVEEQDA